MDVKLIDQLFIKLSPEYKTKKETYERIKRELSLDVKEESIKKAHERYLKKKETGQDKTGQKKDTGKRTTGQDKGTKIKTAIILNKNDKTDEEIIKEMKVSTATFYKYKKQLRSFLIERSQKILDEAKEYAYPDEDEILKRVMGKKRNILINGIKTIEESPTDKDIQMGLRQTLVNIQTIQKEIMKDMQVISPEQQAEYEKELVREKLEQDKEKTKNSDNETNETINFIEDLKDGN